MFSRDRTKGSSLKRALRSPFFLLFLCLSGLALVFGFNIAIPYVIDSSHPIHLPPIKCAEQNTEELYCVERYLDDGRIRFSVSRSDKPDCCIIERYNFDKAAVSYRVLACSKTAGASIDCSKLQESLDYGRRYRVDDEVLSTDPNWEGQIFHGAR